MKITVLILLLMSLVAGGWFWWVNRQVDSVMEMMDEPIPPVRRAFE